MLIIFFIQELTKAQYNKAVGREGTLLPKNLGSSEVANLSDSTFFGSEFYSKQVSIVVCCIHCHCDFVF